MVPTSLRTRQGPGAGYRAPPGRGVVVLVTLVTAWCVLTAVVVGGRLLLGPATPALVLVVPAALATVLVLEPVRRRAERAPWRSRRADPLAILEPLAEGVRANTDPASLLRRVAQGVAEGTGADRVTVRVAAEPHGPPLVEVRHGGEPRSRSRPELVLPLRSGTAVVGSLVVELPRERTLVAGEERLVRDVAAGAGPVAAAMLSREQLRRRVELARRTRAQLWRARIRVVEAQAAERRRVAADIHDTCQQRAAVLAGKLGLAVALADSGSADELEALDAEIRADLAGLRRSLENVTVAADSRLPGEEGLAAALAADTRGLGADVVVDHDGADDHPAAAVVAYHVCLEAVQNAVRHGRARRVEVSIRHEEGTMRFRVTDDGDGFDPDAVPAGTGSGIPGMRARLGRVGGRLTITSGNGVTAVTGSVPLVSPGGSR